MAGAFSPEQRREIAGRARTIHERLDGPPNERGGDPPYEPGEVLAAWAEQFPDESAFAERLAREEIDEATVREQLAATRWPAGEPLPDWLDDLEALVRHVEGHRERDRRPVATPDGTPFAELLEAVVDHARARLDADEPTDASPDGSPARLPGFESWLVARLNELCIRTLYVEFKTFVEHHDPELAAADPADVDDPGTTYYDGFVDAMFDDGVRKLCVEYPVLARQVVALVDAWVEAVTTTRRRLEADRAALADRFGVGGEVTALTPLADDAHAGGQVPVRAEFETGAVVYKPRPVDAGIALYTVLDRLDEHLPTPGFDAPTYLSRDGYGWMEPVEYADPADAAAVERYYERAGVLLCVAYVLDLPDCQYENVLATGDQPTVLDAETVCHPAVDPAASSYGTEVTAIAADSVLRPALLPWTVGDPGGDEANLPKSVLTAGLGSSSEETAVTEVTKPTVEAVNTDVMSVTGESPTVDRSTNTPTLDGVDQPPDGHLDTIVGAFRRTHETIRELHADGRFLAEVAGPELFAGVENRLVFRGTDTYRANLRVSAKRAPLRDGARLTVEHERLAAPFFDGRIGDDRYWPLYDAERRALLRRDVPRFASGPMETAIRHDGESTGVEADTPGYERCRRRLDAMDDADLRRQTWILRRCLDDAGPERAAPSTTLDLTDERLRREAVGYGDRALDAAVETGPGRGWVSLIGEGIPQICISPADDTLYDGRGGIGLAAAALYDRTGHERFRETAVAALDAVAADRGEEPTPFGGVNGTGSLVYALAVAADLLDRPAYRERAEAFARDVSADRLAADEVFDVVDGTAGMLLALLAHHERHGGTLVLDRAVACGERLLDARVAVDGHRVWTTGADEPQPGLAHGVSGIAYALARLAAATGDDRYEEAAREALDYEATLFDPARTNFAIPTETGESRFQDRWCRGRTGCALARLGIGTHLGDDDLLAEANALLDATADAEFGSYDHLCCGNLGRAVGLLEAARRTGREPDDARAVVGRCLARREETGALAMPGHGEPVVNPTFSNGVSGVAYTLLRLREPDSLPCVLLLE